MTAYSAHSAPLVHLDGTIPPPAIAILRATRAEAPGALLKVAGLSVIERSLRQLRRVPGLRIAVIADGTIPMPDSARVPEVDLSPVTSDPDAAIATLSRTSGGPLPAVIGADVVRRQGEALTGGLRVIDEATRRQAEDGIFADLLRGDLGIVARHVNKKISFRITRHLLCKLPVTPNQVTLAAAVVGFVGCLLIATGTYRGVALGFLLAQAQSVLDGCDGELARVRFQQSAIGEWLDTLVDDFLNLSLVASMGIGLWRGGQGSPAAIGAAVACAMLLVYNAVSYRELVRQGVGGELLKIRWRLAGGIDMKSMMNQAAARTGRAKRAFLALGRRDVFIFGWMLLAFFDLLPMALVWAMFIALSCFVTAVGQLVTRARAPDPGAT